MVAIQRARQMLVLAVVGALAIAALEFPFRQLLSQRAAIAQTAASLAAVRAHNATLRQDIVSLRKMSTVAAIAHQEYGLVHPGQVSYVVLPAANAHGAKSPVSSLAIPAQDIASTSAHTTKVVPPRPTPPLWRRVLDRLEFWR